MNKKVYARQIPPEFQESPFDWYGEEYIQNDTAIFGNPHFKKCGSDVLEIFGCLDTISEELENVASNGFGYKNKTAVFMDYIPPKNKKHYSTKNIHDLIYIFENKKYWENDEFTAILSIVYGKEYDYKLIRGCCQGDWNYFFYPVADFDNENISFLEDEYFNLGTEWIIHDEEKAPESPEDISGYGFYAHGWNEEKIKEEIANAEGISPDDVIIYCFNGYSRNVLYKVC